MQILFFVLVIIALLALSVGLQMFRMRRAPIGRVLLIFSNLRYAEKISKESSYSLSVKRFRVDGWQKNKNKVPFLPEELRTELDGIFGRLADVNDEIDRTMKFKSNAYMVSIDVNKLEKTLVSCKEKLQQWLQANMHNPEYQPKRMSLFRW
jgi:hypothetical protein